MRIFSPPRYLVPPLAGIDVSASGVKAVRLEQGSAGLILTDYAEMSFPIDDATKTINHAVMVQTVRAVAQKARLHAANVSLSESKSYIFETTATGSEKHQWRTSVEQRLQEFIPIPPSNAVFDIVEVGQTANGETRVVGAGALKSAVDEIITTFDEAAIDVRALETESFAIVRALVPHHDESTALVIDVGKTTTKIGIASRGIPRFTTTIGVGGHSLTQAVQKHFGVSEEEATTVKNEQGIVPSTGDEDYLGAMLSTLTVIRDEISDRLNYWQVKSTQGGLYEPVTRVILVGGNASVRGLPEYFEKALGLPVKTGDVFTNFASRDVWLPPLAHNEAIVYATAIGLALYDLETV